MTRELIPCTRCRRQLTDVASRKRRYGRSCAIVDGIITPREARAERLAIAAARPSRAAAIEALPLFAADDCAAPVVVDAFAIAAKRRDLGALIARGRGHDVTRLRAFYDGSYTREKAR